LRLLRLLLLLLAVWLIGIPRRCGRLDRRRYRLLLVMRLVTAVYGARSAHSSTTTGTSRTK
jgi:hypothetical protein